MTKELKEKIRKHAFDTRKSQGEIIREAVGQYFLREALKKA